MSKSKVKVTRDKKRKTAESSLLTMHSKAWTTASYAARSSRLYHCVTAGGDGDGTLSPPAVHADSGLQERSSGVQSSGALHPPVLRHWENQRVLSSYLLRLLILLFFLFYCQYHYIMIVFV